MSEVWEKLKAPFPPEAVSWRVGSTSGDKKRGLALAYIDARDVMERLDAVLGAASWKDEYHQLGGDKLLIVTCRLSVRVDGEWITKEDGAGTTDVEGEKGAISDAFKRAAVKFGIGRYLYSLDPPWVDLEDGKRIAKHEYPRLRALLAGGQVQNQDAPTVQKAPARFGKRPDVPVAQHKDVPVEKEIARLAQEIGAKLAAAAEVIGKPRVDAILREAGAPPHSSKVTTQEHMAAWVRGHAAVMAAVEQEGNEGVNAA